MRNYVAHSFGMNLALAEKLVKDLSPEQMVQQPHGLINHPAWSLGHLAVSADAVCKNLGAGSTLPDGWAKPFGTGQEPSGDASAYPAKDEILDMLKTQHARAVEALQNADDATLAQPFPDEKARSYFPTLGDFAVFLMTSHEMDHLGQVAAWRRAAGVGPA